MLCFSLAEVNFQYYRDPDLCPTGPDPYDGVYNDLPKKHHALRKVKNCEFCSAKKFPGEGPAFCCMKGKVDLYMPDLPSEIRRLFTSLSDKDARYFRKHIRYFNSHFSFTSFGVSIDRRLASAKGSGVYCFKAHGQMYHKLDPLTPSSQGPRHMQLYFYDTDDSIEHRVKRSPNLDRNLIRSIRSVLRQDNPYVQVFTSLGTVANIEEYTIALNTSISVDQRRYNAPAMDQVAAIWVDGTDPQHRFDRSIVIYGKENEAHYIRAYYGCYDPLAYPLFFPSGETGWEDKRIMYRVPPRSKPKRKYTKRTRRGLCN
jgi:hypothetical protein